MAVDAPQASEKEFYLRTFRHRSIVMYVSDARAAAAARGVVEELIANRTLVLLISPASVVPKGAVRLRTSELTRPTNGLSEVSARLLTTGIAHVVAPGRQALARLRFSCRLAIRLGVHKLVVVDRRGGIRTRAGLRSFLDAASLARLAGARSRVEGWSRAELRELHATVRAGVDTINLTAADGLAAELFSYEGSGTLLTASDYCRVARLTLDDFPHAMALLEQGEREGFLLERSANERATLLLSAYGAWFDGQRLAGIAALETEAYKSRRLAEVVGLYTITRFKGEGVGVRILTALATAAAERGRVALFACTANARAGAFFERNHFRRVEDSAVPPTKWAGRRGPRPSVFWRDL